MNSYCPKYLGRFNYQCAIEGRKVIKSYAKCLLTANGNESRFERKYIHYLTVKIFNLDHLGNDLMRLKKGCHTLSTYNNYYKPERLHSAFKLYPQHFLQSNHFCSIKNDLLFHPRNHSYIFTFHQKHSTRYYSQETVKKAYKGYIHIERKWILMAISGLATGALLYLATSKNSFVSKNDKSIKEDVGQPKGSIRSPMDSKEIPDIVPYLIIGGGTASFAAFRAIKSIESTAKILVITKEPYNPYMRPPLSKELIFNKDREKVRDLIYTQWDGSERSIFFEPDEFYTPCNELLSSESGGVSIANGWSVTKIDPFEKYAVLEDGKVIKYNKCLIASGATPKNLSVFAQSSPAIQKKVSLYRNIQDFTNLDNLITKGAKTIAVIGGGFSGSELSCSLTRKGISVTQIFKEENNLEQLLPKYLSQWLASNIEKQGVCLVKNAEINRVSLENEKVNIEMKDQRVVSVDHVIVTVGVEPNTDIAEQSGLEVDAFLGGFLVNAELEALKDLFAAGDCACFYDMKLGRRRIEHHDHAVVSGRLAGENMTGAGKPFEHQSMFWSDLGPALGFEAIGIVDPSLSTVGVFMKPINSQNIIKNASGSQSATSSDKVLGNEETNDYKKGIVFYLRNKKVVGLVLWNLFNRVPIARQVLKSNIEFEDFNEVAKLFKFNGVKME